MTEAEIFKYLFKVAKTSKDPEGVVAACLVRDGEILVSSASADDGIRHAEDLVIKKAKNQGIKIDNMIVLYTTLEPCSYRSAQNKVQDCTTIIINSGIKNVVCAAKDPDQAQETVQRLKKVKVNFKQVEDQGTG